jgi:uncharacterized Ntn-hydrolase superfamily protein
MTFSLSARCARTGAFGIAITSSSICVASRCAWVGPRGTIVTQNVTDPALGPLGQSLLQEGAASEAIVGALVAATPEPEWRQIGVVDASGRTAWHSGAQALGIAAVQEGNGCLALGNLLADPGVPTAMVAAFEAADAALPLAERLMRGLEAGLAAGGETGPLHAAGLHVATGLDWPSVDLRVDWDEAPIAALRGLWTLYAPQQAAFETRAKTPSAAPAF